MQKMYKPVRIGLLFVIMAVFFSIYVSALYRMQIYDTVLPDSSDPPQRTLTRTVTLPSARGNIYDRNGVLLASGRPSYNITLDRAALLRLPNTNDVISKLIYTAMDEGVSYNDAFPITQGAPFSYLIDMTSEQRRRLDAYMAFFSYDPDMSASDLLAQMREHYKIDYTVGIADARLIIGVRYELEMRAIIGTITPYVFASDVSSEFVTLVESLGLIGVHSETGFIREYYTSYAAHILGYVRPMSPEQYDKYKDLGYPMDAVVGQTGAELAFEDTLRGIDGKQLVTTNESGAIMDIKTLQEPEPGKHVYLSMDIGLQTVAEHALSARISVLNQDRQEEDAIITGGAVVVTDVWTGEILAAATYPTYDPMTLTRDYALLSTDPTMPMLNRATQGRYNPGSTFKMVTAFTGLRSGVINRNTVINDVGRFTKYESAGYAPSCWLYSATGVGHGPLTVVQALERSCNYFFIQVADWLPGGSSAGARLLAATAQDFGLGRKTGLEIPENAGRLATPEWKKETQLDNGLWFAADTLMTAFGQGHNMFTPVQLANYAATIGNGGTLHALTILRRIKSADFTETIFTHEPVVLNEIQEKDYIQILQEGMKAVARGSQGTAKKVFSNYPIHVAAKTGTVQVEGRDINDGVFVCYAPAENPEISISIVIEQGGSGSAVMDIAKTIFDYYFKSETTVRAVPYGELIP